MCPATRRHWSCRNKGPALGYRRAYRRKATKAERSSSHATGTRGKVSQPGHRRMNGWSAACGNEKNSRPWKPPNPYDEDASTKIGTATWGNLPGIKSKCRPRFRDSTRCHMRKAITMRGVSGTCAAGSCLTRCRERHDNRGRQKGLTHAAYYQLFG